MNLLLSEGDQVPVDLTPIWIETNTRYCALTENKPTYRCIRWLIEHILDAGYSKGLLPGTSMYGLLDLSSHGWQGRLLQHTSSRL